MQNGNGCPGCSGRRMVENSRGVMSVCPLCEGTGNFFNYDPQFRHYIVNQALAALQGPVQAILTIDAQADFQLVWLCRTSSGGTFTSSIRDTSTGRQWDNLPVNDLNRWGTAQAPFPVGLSPVILKAQSSLSISVTDTSGNANNLQLAFIGYDLYPVGK